MRSALFVQPAAGTTSTKAFSQTSQYTGNADPYQDLDVLCAAIDPDGDDYVRRIFGWRNYRIVDDPQSLPKQLTALCARWVAR